VHRLRVLSQPVHGTATYRCDDTRGCVMQFWPPDDEHMCSKHVEARNKLFVKQNFCTLSWLITEINIFSMSSLSLFKFRTHRTGSYEIWYEVYPTQRHHNVMLSNVLYSVITWITHEFLVGGESNIVCRIICYSEINSGPLFKEAITVVGNTGSTQKRGVGRVYSL